MQPKISIVIPIYNVEPYLRQCLDSVVNQTMRNIQIICVNDGSTDGSQAILEEYAAKDERILVINKKNEGQGIARNLACESIRGKYTLFVDADDWVESNLCHHTYCRAEAEQADVVFALREKNDSVEGPISFCKLVFVQPNREERIFLLENIIKGPVAKLYRTDFLRQNNIAFTHHRRCQDIPFHWLCCLMGNRYVIHPEVLYHVRVVEAEPGQGKWEKVRDAIGAHQSIKASLIEKNLYNDYRDAFLKDYFKSIHVAFKKIVKQEQKFFIQDFLETLSLDDISFLRQYRSPSTRTRMFYNELIAVYIDKKTFSLTMLGNRVNDSIRTVILPFEKMWKKNRQKKSAKQFSVGGAEYHKRQFQGLNDTICRLSETVVNNNKSENDDVI